MRRRAFLKVLTPILLLVAFVLGIVIFDRAQIAWEQAYLATATVYIPPTKTATTPTTAPVKVPVFSITDETGKVYSQKDFADKPTVLCFWNVGDTKAKSELVIWEGILKEYTDKVNLVVVHVNDPNAGTQAALAYLEGENFSFTPYFDLSGDAARAYDIGVFPTTYFLDAKAEVKARARGNVDIRSLPVAMERIGVQ